MDSNQFTQQLTQMTGVEQQLLTNDLLTSLLAAQSGSGLGGASNYIGKDATASWAVTKLDEGSATWSYELGGAASEAKLEVLDCDRQGRLDRPGSGPHHRHPRLRLGRQDHRRRPAAGRRRLFAEGHRQERRGARSTSQVLTRGRVTGVEMYDGVPYLTIGNSIVPVSSVIALDEHVAAAAATDDDAEASLAARIASALNPLKLLS